MSEFPTILLTILLICQRGLLQTRPEMLPLPFLIVVKSDAPLHSLPVSSSTLGPGIGSSSSSPEATDISDVTWVVGILADLGGGAGGAGTGCWCDCC